MTDLPRVLILADDLTGAMDAAGPFASRGLATTVVALPEECDAARVARSTVVAINTESRHLGPDEAAERVARLFRQVVGESFALVVKKVDSTLRGNVVVETASLRAAAQRPLVLGTPAFPAQGRTVRDGHVFVHGTPLAETAFASDALSSALTEALHEAFARHTGEGGAVCSATHLDTCPTAGLCLVDAQNDDELDRLARHALARPAGLLLFGSAGLTSALARCLPSPGGRAEPPAVLGRIVYVIGSRAQASRDQAAALINDGARLVEAVNGRLHKEPVLAPGADVVLMAVPDKQGNEGDAQAVATMLARHAIRLAGPGNAQAVVATGGDTALAFLRTSGNAVLTVGGELMPGIAYARFMMGSRPVWLVTKAGGFGDANALRTIGQRLRDGVPQLQ